MEQVCFGVDIGGTSVKLGLVSEAGELLKKVEFPSSRDQNAMLDGIAEHIRSIRSELGELAYVGAGAGVPGPVLDHSRVNGCVNLGWGEVDVADELSRRTGLPVLAENDANLAAMGELWQGAGRGRKSLALLTVGTGIGCGVIADGRIITGANGAAGEAGHIPMGWHKDWKCSCGKTGCLEVTASATGIIRAARQFSPFREMERVTAKDVFDAAKAGSVQALEVVTEAGRCLGTAAAIIGCVVNPEVFVIGGGVSAAGRMLLDPVEAAYREWVFYPAKGAEFLLAQLGNNAGMIGAAALFFCKV